MNITETGFEALLLFSPRIFSDERGRFFESWRLADYKKYGIHEDFLQDNVSISYKDVIRGMHAQGGQGQMVTVTHGCIFDVVIDNRPNSETYGRYFSVILDSFEGKQLYMPPGFFHGFCVMSDLAVVQYKCTEYYDPAQESGIVWNDREIGISWPVSSPIVSEKDRKLKKFCEVYA